MFLSNSKPLLTAFGGVGDDLQGADLPGRRRVAACKSLLKLPPDTAALPCRRRVAACKSLLQSPSYTAALPCRRRVVACKSLLTSPPYMAALPCMRRVVAWLWPRIFTFSYPCLFAFLALAIWLSCLCLLPFLWFRHAIGLRTLRQKVAEAWQGRGD